MACNRTMALMNGWLSRWGWLGFFVTLCMLLTGTAWGQSTTTTTLTIPASSSPAGFGAPYSVAVTSPGKLVSGQVLLCDANAPSCSGPAILTRAQLTSNGTASIQLALGPGAHSVKAVYSGTRSFSSSTSSSVSITYLGGRPTTTSLSFSKAATGYNFTAALKAIGTQPLSAPVTFQNATAGNIVLGTALPGTNVATLGFASAAATPTGSVPVAVAVADFNGDGISDMAVVNTASNTVTPLIGLGNGTFQDLQQTFTTGNSPAAIVAGDFNNDGVVDLAVANVGDNTVTYYYGRGDGSFYFVGSIVTGGGPANLVAGDFNRDGQIDLAVVNRSESSLSILLGTGAGFSAVAAKPLTGSTPYGIATGDFNGDGYPDLVVPNYFSNTASVYLGHGDGTYSAAINLVTGVYPSAVVVGDFNGDGKADLAVTNSFSKTVTLYLGNGLGQFNASVPALVTGNNPGSLVIGDFNGDGKQDLAVANTGSNNIDVYLGHGDGTYASPLAVPTANAPGAVSAGDFNVDGLTDLLVAYATTNQAQAVLNTSTTVATASISNIVPLGPASLTVFAQLASSASYASSQSNNVIVAGTPISTTTTLYVGASTAAIGEIVQIAATVKPSTYGSLFISAPVTLYDGASVLASASPVNGVVSFNFSFLTAGTHNFHAAYPGDGTFAGSATASLPMTVVASTASTTTLATSAASVAHGTVVDLTATVTSSGAPVTRGTVNFCNADAAHCTDTSLLRSVQLTPSGTASARLALPVGSHRIQAVFSGAGVVKASTSTTQTVSVTGTYPVSIAMTASGAAGSYALTAKLTGQTSQPLPYTPVQLVDTSNAGLALASAYPSQQLLPFSLETNLPGLGVFPFGVVTGDFNNDGKMDAIVANFQSQSFNVMLGNGNGTFKALPAFPTPASPWEMVAGDFNGDGKLDFVVGDLAHASVVIELGNGDGTFTAKTTVATGQSPSGLAVADFNGDGILDIAVANTNSNSLSILIGKGDGTFVSDAVSLLNIMSPYSIAVADFDGDGRLDLAVATNPTGVTMLYGYGDGTFRLGTSPVTATTSSTAVATGDFNGDGRPDLALGTKQGMMIFLNQGSGTFTNAFTLANSDFVSSIVVTDVNADGIPDLAWTGAFTTGLNVATGYGNGVFSTASQSFPGATIGMVAAADFDQDGSSDLILANYSGSTAPVFLNRSISTATFNNISIPGSGAHLLQATLPAGGIYTAGASNTVSLTGTPVTPSVLVVPSPGSIVAVGQAVTVTVNVLTIDNFAATGSVSLYDGATLLKTATLTNGQATDTVTFASTGTHNLSATYGGNANLTTAKSATTPVYVAQASTTTLTLSSAQVTTGTSVLLKATTVSASKGTTLAETVNFCIATAPTCTGSALLATAQLGTVGTAQVSLVLPIGSYSIKAVFQGSQVLLPSSSAPVALTVTGLKPTVTQLTSTGSAGTYALTAKVIGPGTQPLTGTVAFTNTSTKTALGSVALSAGTTRLSFLANQSQVAGNAVSQMAAGDFDNDGKPDVMVLDAADNLVGFMPGNGNGAVTAKSGFSFNGTPNGIAAGDFNGDGKLDLVIGSQQVVNGTSELSVLYGNGDGTFPTEALIFIPGPANQIAVGDFNRDGRLDIVVIDFSQNITLISNFGDGAFTPITIPVKGVSGLQAVTVADFNGDGNLDAAVTTFGRGVLVYLGNGAGNLTLSTTPLLPNALPGGIVAADLNKDGKIDLAVTDYATSSVITLLGKGDGTFTQGASTSTGFLPSKVAAGDFNLDGNVDVVVLSLSTNAVACLLGNGTGAFTAQNLTLPATAQPSSMVVGDFNHDGQLDVLVGDSSVGMIYGLINSLSTSATATLASARITGTANQTVNATYSGSTVYATSTSNALVLAP